MKFKKLGVLMLAGVMALSSASTALAAKREKVDASAIDFAAVLEDTSAKGSASIYHWWTAGGERTLSKPS